MIEEEDDENIWMKKYLMKENRRKIKKVKKKQEWRKEKCNEKKMWKKEITRKLFFIEIIREKRLKLEKRKKETDITRKLNFGLKEKKQKREVIEFGQKRKEKEMARKLYKKKMFDYYKKKEEKN